LKAHFPAHFYAAVLSNEIANTEKVARYVSEMKAFNIQLLPPDINSSHEGFTPVGGAIRFGLAAIKGLGSTAVQLIVQARSEGGAFRSIYDFAERVDQKAVNKRVLESLIKAGAFDALHPQRSSLMPILDKAIEYGAQVQRDRSSGQGGLFALAGDGAAEEEPPIPENRPWTRKESLTYEKEALGFYVSGHPLEDYADSIRELSSLDSGRILEGEHGDQVASCGIIIDLSLKTTKKGDRFALFRLEDQFGSVKIVCWPEQFNRYKTQIQADLVVLVKGRLELSDDGAATIITQEIQQLESARAKAARTIILKVAEDSINEQNLRSLNEIIAANPGNASILFELTTNDGVIVRLRPHNFLRLNLSPELIGRIEQISDAWRVEYN
ncbi:MAG: hypothetical protein J2P41_17795, partial [Blastocatellia bacterium]|nr:hypothetical protein [Blastocatellia bacterium]